MARLPRIAVPDTPHYATLPGNQRQPIFFADDVYVLGKGLLVEC